MIILPAKSTEYSSKVIETKREIFLKDSPLDLIKRGCLGGGAGLEGRLESVTLFTGIERKIPVPIFPDQGIYCFPTHSPKHNDCCWIFPAHIRRTMANKNNPKQSIVVFKNNLSIILDIPHEALQKQIHRTAYCVLCFTSWYDDGDDLIV